MEPISEERLNQVHPELARRVRQLADALSFTIRVTQGLRTWNEQDKLYAQGRTDPGQVVTNAPGGHSQHNFGLAVDVVPIVNGLPDWDVKGERWQEILSKAPSFGLAEGAEWRTFPDNPHLYPQEVPANPDDNLRNLFQEGGIAAVWNNFSASLGPAAPSDS